DVVVTLGEVTRTVVVGGGRRSHRGAGGQQCDGGDTEHGRPSGRNAHRGCDSHNALPKNKHFGTGQILLGPRMAPVGTHLKTTRNRGSFQQWMSCLDVLCSAGRGTAQFGHYVSNSTVQDRTKA